MRLSIVYLNLIYKDFHCLHTLCCNYANSLHIGVIGYRVLYVDDAETQPKLNVSVGANISSIELTGLMVNTNYCIQVLAFSSQGDGNGSDCLFTSTGLDGT